MEANFRFDIKDQASREAVKAMILALEGFTTSEPSATDEKESTATTQAENKVTQRRRTAAEKKAADEAKAAAEASAKHAEFERVAAEQEKARESAKQATQQETTTPSFGFGFAAAHPDVIETVADKPLPPPVEATIPTPPTPTSGIFQPIQVPTELEQYSEASLRALLAAKAAKKENADMIVKAMNQAGFSSIESMPDEAKVSFFNFLKTFA